MSNPADSRTGVPRLQTRSLGWLLILFTVRTDCGASPAPMRPQQMFAAVDVHYPPSAAQAALVLAPDSAFSAIVSEKTALIDHVAPTSKASSTGANCRHYARSSRASRPRPAHCRWLRHPGPGRQTRPGRTRPRGVRRLGHRSGQNQLRAGRPRDPRKARYRQAATVRGSSRHPASRRGRTGPYDDRKFRLPDAFRRETPSPAG